ncbi:unnamed protein product [Moneuplotes crassus]|uniref:Uncharacterized protein n=1 Tax=Euplotes crassus TaxID=5936 RepID=A0AAD1XSA4_EUPCR|nr:unnamed protein product [Moneuplotes crassus]
MKPRPKKTTIKAFNQKDYTFDPEGLLVVKKIHRKQSIQDHAFGDYQKQRDFGEDQPVVLTSGNQMKVRDEYFYMNFTEQGRRTVLEKQPKDYAKLIMNSLFIKRTDFKHFNIRSKSRNIQAQDTWSKSLQHMREIPDTTKKEKVMKRFQSLESAKKLCELLKENQTKDPNVPSLRPQIWNKFIKTTRNLCIKRRNIPLSQRTTRREAHKRNIKVLTQKHPKRPKRTAVSHRVPERLKPKKPQ